MIQVDTREVNNSHIISYFIHNDIPHIRSKMYVGDYCKYENPKLVIERKASILELAGNVGKEHMRFKDELTRLDKVGGRMVMLIEETEPIELWSHKRSQMNGIQISKILKSWESKHCFTVMQIKKADAGFKIAEILGYELKENI